eukprot:1144275-Pelagomonas_calceolata.AAC.1
MQDQAGHWTFALDISGPNKLPFIDFMRWDWKWGWWTCASSCPASPSKPVQLLGRRWLCRSGIKWVWLCLGSSGVALRGYSSVAVVASSGCGSVLLHQVGGGSVSVLASRCDSAPVIPSKY